MKKAIWWIVGIVVVVVLIVIATRSSNTDTGPIKIGFIAPLSADGAPYGESVKGGGGIGGMGIGDRLHVRHAAAEGPADSSQRGEVGDTPRPIRTAGQ